MIINDAAIDAAFRGFKTVYTDAYNNAPVFYDKIAMTVQSNGREEEYGWIGQFPQLREWLGGDRIPKSLSAHGFSIQNRKFEGTVSVSRDDFSDDRLGLFKPQFSEMGHRARQHPDELVFDLLARGTTETCFDGQYFFDTDHPTVDAQGNTITAANYVDGPGHLWVLMDTSRSVKPLIWQEREKYDFQQVTRPNDYQVFMSDQYYFGVRARVNCGFGLWQLAYASREPLDTDSYARARAAMMKYRGDQGRILGIVPDTLVVGPDLETSARNVLKAATGAAGQSNPWVGSAEVITSPYFAE